MDAPPPQEDIRPWLRIAGKLREVGLHAPEVLAEDAQRGFVLMSDLGHTHYLEMLNEDNADALYGEAMDALLIMQRDIEVGSLPTYDAAMLHSEVQLMTEWFLGRHLGIHPDATDRGMLEAAFDHLIESATSQQQVFVHRDFHSRNLLHTETNTPGIIDFQGAVRGPITYDLASLLRDCYIRWPLARVESWVETYRRRLLDEGMIMAGLDRARFLEAFNRMCLQRHIKVLGIFCRLHYRDGKAGYLKDLPRVFDYIQDVAARQPQVQMLARFLRRCVGDRDLTLPLTQA
jgi:aminoglycoside/choline kinase family phosphotransferase